MNGRRPLPTLAHWRDAIDRLRDGDESLLVSLVADMAIRAVAAPPVHRREDDQYVFSADVWWGLRLAIAIPGDSEPSTTLEVEMTLSWPPAATPRRPRQGDVRFSFSISPGAQRAATLVLFRDLVREVMGEADRRSATCDTHWSQRCWDEIRRCAASDEGPGSSNHEQGGL